jgi:putative DNA methylase
MTNLKETKIHSPKKLIEVALPLDDINFAAAREKSIRHGHPSTLHLWWARRPLAAARAVIFAQMVNDPGYQQDSGFKYGVNKKEAEVKREKLFQIIRDLVKWENTNNEEVLNRARNAIKESWRETCHLNRNHPQAAEMFNPEKLPAFHDPFAGGGAIPLEAQRLGLESYGSDLNPVAVMINKAMIEIPPKFAGQAPVGPIPEGDKQQKLMDEWSGAKGLAEDVRRYGHWMREEAFKRIGHLYPKVKITDEMIAERSDLKPYAGEELTVIAWLWARTVKSPNPAFSHVDVPLVKSYSLATKPGKEAWIEPVIEGCNYTFTINKTKAQNATVLEGTVKRGGAICLLSGSPISFQYIRDQATDGKMGERLLAVIAQGKSERVYLPPSAIESQPELKISDSEFTMPETQGKSRVNIGLYGMTTWEKLYTRRQFKALSTLGELVSLANVKIRNDLIENGEENQVFIDDYSKAISTYLALATSKAADNNSTMCSWMSGVKYEVVRNTYSRQALAMTWDFAESNVFAGSSGDFYEQIKRISKIYEIGVCGNSTVSGHAFQEDAQLNDTSNDKVISTDPPYYDNISYADLSDFFYVWLRRTLREFYPEVFGTMVVPKAEELVATPYRHENKVKAEQFFMTGMTSAMHKLAQKSHCAFPVTIYYAFKQSETKEAGTSNSGWETFLDAVVSAGFDIRGTWPLRTERGARLIGVGNNALASSIVLVCKKRDADAISISRREFQRELRDQMPDALEAMIGGETGATPIAPVDLAQAAIGPGMAIYSKYAAVLNQDGSKMSVHDALILINRAITDYLNPDSGNFDADTLFCDDWFSQYGWSAGQFGEANVLAQAKGTSVDGVKDAGVIDSGSGQVRLLKWGEYPQDWDPKTDTRTPIWEACHHMIRVLNQQGEGDAGALLARMPEFGEPIRQLAYHLYTLCERKKWADDARAYNELIGSWHAIVSASHEVGHKGTQTELGLDF